MNFKNIRSGMNRPKTIKYTLLLFALITGSFSVLIHGTTQAQQIPHAVQWIRPDNEHSAPVWGIHNGIVIALWPASIEKNGQNDEGGPRGLLRIGYEYMGAVYLINFIAVEPLVNNDMEFSEVSPSQVDGKWGKLFWASDSVSNSAFKPFAGTRGVITHPDKLHP